MSKKIKDEYSHQLFEAILSLKTVEECEMFFEDLCTITEIKAMSQRLEVAKLLEKNDVYSKICTQTGASSATISRVNRSLNYGCDGYKIVLDRLKELK